jgi:4-amino-4-deoxy-L-arabinose transferase-like glycosyltransferase
MRGEEPRRVRVAFEMLDRGDWLVPREQGEPFLSRPPLHNWLIALSSLALGRRDARAARLPSVLATLFTTLLVYRYARLTLSRVGALAAAVAFATLGELFTTGSQAETEAVFIALVSASLLLWHAGHLRGWPGFLTWSAGHVFAGLAVLTKGPQAPVYFLASAGAYLVLTGQRRRFFSRGHLVGALAGAAVVLGWLIPFSLRLGWEAGCAAVMGDAAARFRDWQVLDVVLHLAQFPLEVVGCTLPWSPLLLCYLSPQLRRSLGEARPHVLFLGVCLAVAFPTCWLPPGGQTRYFAPLYPGLAVLIGLVIQRRTETEGPPVPVIWRWYITGAAALMVGAAAVVLAASGLARHPHVTPWAEPLPVALAYAVAAVVLAALTLRARGGATPSRVRTAVLALACFMVLTFAGVLTDVRIRRGGNPAAAVERLREQLPEGQRLVSFGHIDALFAYHYGRPIEPRPWPEDASDLPAGGGYFCFDWEGPERPELPFAWEEVAAIPMDRNRHDPPERVVVIGRLVPQQPLDHAALGPADAAGAVPAEEAEVPAVGHDGDPDVRRRP